MKNLRRLEANETRNLNGGSIAGLIITGLTIAGPFADVAWNIGQGLGQIIVNRFKK